MTVVPLIPATLSFLNGIPYAKAFGDVYHSADGGAEQARHVFLAGNGLPARWQNRARFTIIETGFGLGLNFLVTWNAWRNDPTRAQRLHYVSIEKHPFQAADLEQLHAIWPELATLSNALRSAWPPLVPGFHRLLLDEGRVILTLAFGDIADVLPQLDIQADAFYLDGFAPGKNPGMWTSDMLSRLNRLAALAATLATYTVSAPVRRSLAQAGFVCEKVAGFGRKREMLRASFTPRWQVQDSHSLPAKRKAIVIGAGLAGSAACERLGAHGWHVTLIDRRCGPAQEASGNVAGIAMPLLSKDDNPTSRLTRAAYLFTLQRWRQLGGVGKTILGETCGVLQRADDEYDARIQQSTAAQWQYPADFARWLEAAQVAHLLNDESSSGGWLFPQGGWVQPASVCRAMLAACEKLLETRFSHSVAQLKKVDGGWQVLDAQGICIAEAPVVILANGTNATNLSPISMLPLSSIRGQVTHLPAALLPALPMVICGDGYVTPPADGICCVGASYDNDDELALRQDSQAGNLARLARLLPQGAAGLLSLPLAGRVGFRCVTPDRLPLVGALPDCSAPISGTRLKDVPRFPGLYGLLGYGSRGLIWASFAAELLASLLEGEPLPVERSLVAALDPARFALKDHRRGVSA